MVMIYINKTKYHVNSSKNLLEICLSLGIDIPYFCWHPALGSVGSCRLCAVKQCNEIGSDSGRIIMSCMSSVTNNMIISTFDKEVQKIRKGILELLMTNHPHDCPVCEEGGNCHLQDMTVMTQHFKRRYIFSKRTHNNQYLGDFISHSMNRCISCYRCVRYYRDYAGGTDFGVYGISNNIYFGRHEEGFLESEHSGNLIDVCPTGVFTDKIYSKNYNRKWDLQYSPSICHHCSIGCNISIGEKYGKLNKIDNRYHKDINRYFICDLGRFGYTYVNSKHRIRNPVKYIGYNKNLFLTKDKAIHLAFKILKKSKRVLGIGSIRSSIENNFSLRKIVGKNNFSSGLLNIDHNCIKLIIDILKNSGVYTPTLREVENYDMIFIVGEDLSQTSPRMALAVRQAAKKYSIDYNLSKNIPNWHSFAVLNTSDNFKKCIYIIHTHETKLDSISKFNYFASIKDQETIMHYISCKINNLSLNCKNTDVILNNSASVIINAFLSSKKPLIISGSHSGSINLIKSSLNIAKGLQNLKKDVGLILLTPEVNSIGASILSSISIEDTLEQCIDGKVDTLIILENNLYRNIIKSKLNLAFKKVKNFIVLDHQLNETVEKSTLFLPICSSSESSGTVINYEGRAQRFFSTFNPSVYYPKSCILEGWSWLYRIYFCINKFLYRDINLDFIISEYTKEISILRRILYISPNSKFRVFGQKIARLPHRASGRTAIHADISVHEKKQSIDDNTMFSFSMEGNQNSEYYSKYIPFSWSPGWNSNHSYYKDNFRKKNFNSGILLFPTRNYSLNYFFYKLNICDSIVKNWFITPYYLLFGSEEMSYYSPEIKKKCTTIFALINKVYKIKLGLNINSFLEFNYSGEIFRFSIKFSNKLPLYQIGLPLGLPGLPRMLIGKMVKNVRGII